MIDTAGSSASISILWHLRAPGHRVIDEELPAISVAWSQLPEELAATDIPFHTPIYASPVQPTRALRRARRIAILPRVRQLGWAA